MVLAVMAKFSLTFILGLFIQVLFEGRTLTSCTCIKPTWATYVTAKDKSVPRIHCSRFLVLVGSTYNSVYCSEFIEYLSNMSTSPSQIELQQPASATNAGRTASLNRPAESADAQTRRASNDESIPPPDATSQIPDGGREAWIMVLASAIFTFWLNGIGNSWGVMQTALLKQGLTSTSTLSFVGSLGITCAVAFSLISVRFMRLVGAKWAGLIGIVMLGLGELTSGFTTSNVAGLFGTTGILFGTGSSLCFVS